MLVPPDNKQKENTDRLMELEDLVKEQDGAISSLMEKIRSANSEIIALKFVDIISLKNSLCFYIYNVLFNIEKKIPFKT